MSQFEIAPTVHSITSTKGSERRTEMARKTAEDWQTLRFHAGPLFTPSSPMNVAELFAGRGGSQTSGIGTLLRC